MTTLVTGGAGYIGAHLTRLLVERGDDVVVVDDLSTGDSSRIAGVALESFDIAAAGAVDRLVEILRGHSVDAVVHFAAKKRVPESLERPSWYAQQNIGGLANLLLAMEAAGVERLVFSSSAAVYGATERPSIREGDSTAPVNPYGFSKLAGERIIADTAVATGLRAASLRYFNVAGAGWDELGDTAVLNLVPMVYERIDSGRPPIIYGTDYDTPDGSCVRDFVHVLDLAEAHLAVLDATATWAASCNVVYNVGTGRGTSVRGMIERISEIAGFEIPPVVEPRREGDPAVVVADPSRIFDELGWAAQRDVDDILQSAWSAHRFQQRLADG